MWPMLIAYSKYQELKKFSVNPQRASPPTMILTLIQSHIKIAIKVNKKKILLVSAKKSYRGNLMNKQQNS